MNNKKTSKLELLLENLFNPINNKDYGLYWLVTNKKSKPLANASELLEYIKKEKSEGSFINRYANLTEDLVLENNIYLDFDLTNKEYLKQEEGNTLKVLEDLSNIIEDIVEEKATDKTKKDFLIKVKKKYEKVYSLKNGFINGFNSFIDSLTNEELGFLVRYVKAVEKEEVKGLSEQEVQQYYINKFEQEYLKEPFKEVIAVVNYFNSIGIKTILNLSGSKGFHLRIPITEINFSDVPELEENPEAVKLFLVTLAELIETKLLKKSKGTSSLDYHVFNKGMQRLPTSKHNKTKLYANFIKHSVKYIEAIDSLEEKIPSYIPEEVDLKENTEKLIESDIYKATIKLATDKATIKTFKNEESDPNYKFNSNNNRLKEVISKIYLPSLRNILGFQIVHILKRSDFNKEEIEDIFKDLHEDYNDYKTTIQGSINYAFKPNAKLVGLKTLINSIKNNVSPEVANEVINYFTTEFKCYIKPEETVLEDPLTIGKDSYTVIFQKVKNTEKFIVPNFTVEGYNLEVFLRKYVYFKHDSKIKAKLELTAPKELTDITIKPKSKDKLKKFEDKIKKLIDLPESMEEILTELDLIINNFKIQQEQEEQLQEMEEELTEEESETTDNINIKFGETEEGFYSQSYRNGIEYNTVRYNRNNEPEIKTNPVANVVIKNVTIILDSLGVLEPSYNVTYYNKTFKTEETVEYLTKKQLIEEFIKATVFYISTKENVETVLNTFIISGTREERITTKTEAYLEGYYIVNGKVIENTKLKNLKHYTSEDVAEAITLLNEIMKDRTEEGKANDSTIYRFMLFNPFSYCLKQIGRDSGLYSLILIGKSKGNKTGAYKTGNYFYLNTEEENTGATLSVLASELGLNSFSKFFDECYNLLQQPETPDVMKKAIHEKSSRKTKNKIDNGLIDNFKAFGLPVFSLNERMEFKDFITERYKIRRYTSESYISKEERTQFNKKYNPNDTEGSILRILAIIGNEFKKKIVPLIESKDNKLYNPEEVTIEILKEIAEETSKETGKPIDFLPEMYTITEDSTNYNYDVASEIRIFLNNEFKQKNNLTGVRNYSASNFTNSIINNDFDFIVYNEKRSNKTKEREFIVNSSKLVKYVNNHVEETVELEELLEYLNLEDILKAKAEVNNVPYSEFIKTQYKITLEETKKKKNITGFYLTLEEVANNLFDFNIDFSKTEHEQEEYIKIEKVENKK